MTVSHTICEVLPENQVGRAHFVGKNRF